MSKKWSLLPKNSFSAIFLACVAPLVAGAQFVVSGEYPVTAPATETLTRAGEIDVASNDQTIIAIWTDARSDRETDIVFTRIDQQGRALDPTGVHLTSTPISETDPLIAHDGSRFVAVWFDGTNTIGAAINSAGTIITGPVAIAAGRPVALTRNERDLAVAIADGTRVTLYDLNSALIPSVIERLGRVREVRVAPFGDEFLAAWVEENSTGRFVVRALIVDRRGAVGELTLTQLGTFEREPTIAAGQSGEDVYLAAASSDRYASVRIEPDRTISLVDAIDSADVVVPRTVEDVVETPGGFEVIMTIDGEPHVLRYNAIGKTEIGPVSGFASDGAGTFSNGRVYTIWQIGGTIIGRTSFAEAGESATILTRAVISQQMPALATSGTSAMIVWAEDFTATQDRIMARVLRSDGPPDTAVAPILLGTRTIHVTGSRPSLAFNGTNYIAAWLDQRNGNTNPAHLRIRTVTPTGGVFTEFTVSTIATASSGATVAGRPGDALVVWSDTNRTRTSLASTPFAQFDIGSPTSNPAAVYGNGAFLVASVTPGRTIRAVLVSPSGTLERTLFETVPPFASLDSKPAVAWSGRSYLLVFRRGNAIYGRMLDRNGETTGDDFPIVDTVDADNPAVAFDGAAFVVAWTERSSPAGEGHIVATRVLPDRTVTGTQLIAATERNEDYPALAGASSGHSIIAYQRMSAEHQNVHRVFTRLMVGPRVPLMRRRSVR